MGKFGAALVFAVLFPYIVTLAWTGTVEGTGVRTEAGETGESCWMRGM